MSWRGQGGKRAKGRRGDQDPELDNTAWLAELEREAAAQADDDDEDDWATTLRGRRPPGPTFPTASAPSPRPTPAGRPPTRATRARSPAMGRTRMATGRERGAPGRTRVAPGRVPGRPNPGRRARARTPTPTGPGARPPPTRSGSRRRRAPDPGWERYGEGTRPDPVPEAFGDPGQDAGAGWERAQGDSQSWADPASGDDGSGWRSAGVETPTGTWDAVEPVGREPDYPALFGELYRRSAAQQDPIWEAPPGGRSDAGAGAAGPAVGGLAVRGDDPELGAERPVLHLAAGRAAVDPGRVGPARVHVLAGGPAAGGAAGA